VFVPHDYIVSFLVSSTVDIQGLVVSNVDNVLSI
jgi:hypothetical protein